MSIENNLKTESMAEEDRRIQRKINISDRLIVSIDVSTKQELIFLCHKISNKVTTLKLGLELLYNCGPGVAETVKSFGYRVMLDAKLHDIPSTVSKAIAAITRLGVDKITIHASGGIQMLKEARRSVLLESEKMKIIPPLLFGVTILTSLDDDDLKSIGYKGNHQDSVMRLVKLVRSSKTDGLICSPEEVMEIRRNFGGSLLIATPGIRIGQDSHNDQKRVSTPYSAIKNGADYIIAGRSITSKDDPAQSISNILNEIERALE